MDFGLTRAEEEALKKVDVRTVDLEDLVDIREIEIDKALPEEQRIAQFVRQIKNPYCFKMGKIAVSVEFAASEAADD